MKIAKEHSKEISVWKINRLDPIPLFPLQPLLLCPLLVFALIPFVFSFLKDLILWLLSNPLTLSSSPLILSFNIHFSSPPLSFVHSMFSSLPSPLLSFNTLFSLPCPVWSQPKDWSQAACTPSHWILDRASLLLLCTHRVLCCLVWSPMTWQGMSLYCSVECVIVCYRLF